jgi:hypothetical protein
MRYIITGTCISLNYDGVTKVVEKTDERYKHIIDAIKTKDFDKIPKIIDGLSNAIAISTNKDFKVDNGVVYIDNKPVSGRISEKIVEYVKEGLDPSCLVNFWRNLQQNPSSRARERLFLFLENGNHPITDDGCFIAYKKVKNDMKDVHSGTFDNSVGSKPSMARELVDDDPEHTCSSGLHVASWEYAQGFAGNILIDCKVNPRNVISIPVDYSNQKMRTCEYEVIAISKGKRPELHINDQKDKVEAPKQNVSPIVDMKEYEKGIEDAEALLTYYKSIGKEYTVDTFIKLKRFEDKSEEYKNGIRDTAEEYLT